jgi:misacylated tRNA(Ala) deacylase
VCTASGLPVSEQISYRGIRLRNGYSGDGNARQCLAASVVALYTNISNAKVFPMPTELMFRDDAYLATTQAKVLDVMVADSPYPGAIVLDRTNFYATSGGQPGDSGTMVLLDGQRIAITTSSYHRENRSLVLHIPREGQIAPKAGDLVTLELAWEPRLKRMRVHSALHLLSVVLPYPVTGGSIADGEGRLDFDIQDAGLDKAEITAQLQALVDRNAAITDSWITDEELDANPGLVKTMSVQPPRGSGRIRLVSIAGIDLQPCGGTHVRNTSEIGQVTVTEIEKKGKQNRRVRIALCSEMTR